MKTISQQLRAAIQSSGLSQYALAKASGVSQGRISEFLAGAPIKSDNLDKLASVLGVSVSLKKYSQKTDKSL